MRIAALIPLVGCFCNLLLAILVLSRNTRSLQNRVYFLLGSFIAVWNLGQFFLFTTDNAASALFWARFLWFGVCFIPTLLYHISMLIAQIRSGWFVVAAYVFSAALAGTIPTEFFITGVRLNGSSGWYVHPGPGLYISTLGFSLMFIGIALLLRKRRALPPMHRSRLTALIVAQAALSILGTNDILPIIGWDYYPYTTWQVYPYGSIAAVSYGVIVAYSVLQHHLLDVQVGFSRFAAQVVRVAFVTITAIVLMLVIALFFPQAYNFFSFWMSVAIFTVSIIIAAVTFPRLFGKGVETLERRILGDRFEYQDRVRAFTQNLPWQNDLDAMLDELNTLLTGAFGLSSYDLVLRDKAAHAFTRTRSRPEEPREHIPELKTPSPVMRFFEKRGAQYLALRALYQADTVTRTERAAREQLADFEADFCLPLMSEEELIGLLFVGAKTNGEPYTSTDLGLLISLTKNLSLVISQLRLKEEILRTQEFELVGRMSRGMAHDLNNLLTPISTLIQLATEGQREAALDENLLDVASRNVRTFRAYIKEALFFSENLRPDIQIGRLDAIVEQTVAIARSARKKAVNIIVETPGEIMAEVDDVLIQRALNNLISNAVDASTAGSDVRVVLERLVKMEAARDWFRIRVIDQGEGIAKENLDRVLRPYFTTKDRGDEGRGFGLGLAISQRIVALHGGQLTITSQLRRGTTVQIDLPSRPQRQPQPLPPPAVATSDLTPSPDSTSAPAVA